MKPLSKQTDHEIKGRKFASVLPSSVLLIFVVCSLSCSYVALAGDDAARKTDAHQFDVVIVGGTPGGVMAAVAVARNGHSAVILERTGHIGGLPANGLGASDIVTRGATGGLFVEFIQRVRKYYVAEFGEDSEQVKACRGGYHFEPHVAEQVFEELLAEYKDRITVRKGRQFDAEPDNVTLVGGAITSVAVTERAAGNLERYTGKVFIDATYEGDLAAAAGAPYRVGRESKDEFNEPFAGRLYKRWNGEVGAGSTGHGDNAVQAYNFRLCLTNREANRIPVPKPKNYNRDEFASFAEDVKSGITTGDVTYERNRRWDGIGRLFNYASLPNGKIDANNQHLMFISTDLPEENWPWPTSGWSWRDRYTARLRDYTLGLLWFVQNDPAMPKEMQERCAEWGLAKDEYADNGHFPRQVYVREGRRVVGEYVFTAHDALPVRDGTRPPVHAASVTASHYALDSHAVRTREPGRVHLDGFFGSKNKPYTVPYGVILPKKVDGLLTPVPVSGTHVGFSTLRMEPCWMALGQASGEAASMCIEEGVHPRRVALHKLQLRLLKNKAVLMYFADARPGDKHYEALQFFAVRGFLPPTAWKADLSAAIKADTAKKWIEWSGVKKIDGYKPGQTSRGEFLSLLFEEVRFMATEHISAIKGW